RSGVALLLAAKAHIGVRLGFELERKAPGRDRVQGGERKRKRSIVAQLAHLARDRLGLDRLPSLTRLRLDGLAPFHPARKALRKRAQLAAFARLDEAKFQADFDARFGQLAYVLVALALL